jgi:hypothetical protein
MDRPQGKIDRLNDWLRPLIKWRSPWSLIFYAVLSYGGMFAGWLIASATLDFLAQG